MKKTTLILSFLMVLIIGCSAGIILHDRLSPAALAQAPNPTHQFSACIVVSTARAISASYINSGQEPPSDRMVLVPQGWTPIGGGLASNAGVFFMCR